jgi:hypothetical protein
MIKGLMNEGLRERGVRLVEISLSIRDLDV